MFNNWLGNFLKKLMIGSSKPAFSGSSTPWKSSIGRMFMERKISFHQGRKQKQSKAGISIAPPRGTTSQYHTPPPQSHLPHFAHAVTIGDTKHLGLLGTNPAF